MYKTVLVIILFTILAAGCSTQTAMVRVLDYGSGGFAGVFTGEVGGCVVEQQANKDFMKVSLHYKGEKCEVTAVTKE